METHKGSMAITATSANEWRQWLSENHTSQASVWLIIFRKESGTPSVYYPEAVDEALCFGWIDSKPNKRNENSYYQFFSQRNPKSNWSRVNKLKIERLQAQNKIAPAGQRMIDIAKNNGTWDALNEVEDLIVPPDLQALFNERPQAWEHWQAFAPSSRRGILEWIFNAKRPDTRLKRLQETVNLAAENKKANFPNT